MKKKAEKRKKTADKSSARDDSSEGKSKKKKPFKLFPNGKMAILAAVPIAIAITIYYVTIVAPTIIPVPHTVDVPFPKLTKFLEGICEWCGTHKMEVLGIGTAFLLPGIFMRTF